MLSMEIRITSTPPGEAPEHVRKAWVGLVLPLAVPEARTVRTVGVLSRPKTFLGMLLAQLLGRTKRQSGFIVDADRAVEILDAHSPDAANWWRENATHSIKPGQRFVFAAESCQELT
jgi:hypothetical protein